MTPPETLADRLRTMIRVEFGMSLPTVSERAAAEALRWFEERLPGVEEAARALWEATPEPDHPSVTWDNLNPGEQGHARSYIRATGLLALIRERVKGESV